MTLEELLQQELPLNRKERFFTGTVLPMIVCKDNFRHLHLLLSLIDGLQPSAIAAEPQNSNVLFFSEYSLVESLVGQKRGRFKGLPSSKDTPDVVILIRSTTRTLIAFEAKVFDLPTVEDLNRQMLAQQSIISCIRNSLGVDTAYHYALLPEKLAVQMRGIKFPIVTWEAIYRKYEPVCRGDYFFEMLRIALSAYDGLVSARTSYGRNCETKLPGQQIYARFKQGTLDKQSMGRSGGLHGGVVRNDVSTGRWRTQTYETSSKNPTDLNRNWFLIKDFVDFIDHLRG